MNKIRITDLKADASKLSLVAELTNAYEPEVGVKQFTRRFEFTAPSDFTISDEVETVKDMTITSFIHSDKNIVETEKNKKFEFEPGSTSLIAEIVGPTAAATEIEKNFLTAPGPPGAVDKGKREERGVRLAISTKAASGNAGFQVKLRIRNK